MTDGLLPQDVGEKQHLQDKEGVGKALPQRRSPHHTSALIRSINEHTHTLKCLSLFFKNIQYLKQPETCCLLIRSAHFLESIRQHICLLL